MTIRFSLIVVFFIVVVSIVAYIFTRSDHPVAYADDEIQAKTIVFSIAPSKQIPPPGSEYRIAKAFVSACETLEKSMDDARAAKSPWLESISVRHSVFKDRCREALATVQREKKERKQ